MKYSPLIAPGLALLALLSVTGAPVRAQDAPDKPQTPTTAAPASQVTEAAKQQFLKIVRAHRAAKSLAANFSATMSLGPETTAYKGSFAFASDDKTRISATITNPGEQADALRGLFFGRQLSDDEFKTVRTGPIELTSVFDGTAVYSFSKPNFGKVWKRPITGTSGKITAFRSVSGVGDVLDGLLNFRGFNESDGFDELKRLEIVSETTLNDVRVVRLTAVPREAPDGFAFTLAVGKEDNLVRQIELRMPEGSQMRTLTITLTDVKLNPDLPDVEFRYTPVDGATVVDLSVPAADTSAPKTAAGASTKRPGPFTSDQKVVTRKSGLKYQDMTVGDGPTVKNGQYVTVHYIGTLTDGKEFDASYNRSQPFEFRIGQGQVIRGWDEGVLGMKVGGRRKLTIPYQLAYGEDGRPPVIPPKATLLFDVVVVGVSDTPTLRDR